MAVASSTAATRARHATEASPSPRARASFLAARHRVLSSGPVFSVSERVGELTELTASGGSSAVGSCKIAFSALALASFAVPAVQGDTQRS